MKWFKKIVASWAREGNNYDEENCKPSRLSCGPETLSPGDEPILNFKVYSAIGGKVVEFRRYDRRTDRSDCQTYIITSDQDFGERIAKIATMENIKA
jgi:hypothetical protein